MEKKTFSIPSISCGHCVNAIKTELTELEGISKVEGDIEKNKLTEINYPAA
jgi:copper chaperone CopZ